MGEAIKSSASSTSKSGSSDYWSPAAAAEVMGGAQELLTAFTGSSHE
jgi:hypothetical protein